MKEKKRVLILGAIDSFCDLIEDYKKMGVETIACDYYEGAPGKAIADYGYDISTLDVEKLVEIGAEHEIDGVLCAFSDRNIEPCYEVAKRLGLPQIYEPELIKKLTDKICMKEVFREGGFPIIEYAIISDSFSDAELSNFNFPVIIKPIDSSGSKGIFICSSVDEIRDKMTETIEQSVSYKDRFIVEEYYPYDEISITAWVSEGKSYVTCIYDNGKNFNPENAANVSLCNVVFPSKYTRGNVDYFRELVQNAVEAFQVKNGPVTIQCFIGPDGLKVNEFICRLAGDGAYMCSEVMGAPAVAEKTESYVIGNPVNCKDLESFNPDKEETYYQIGVYVNRKGKLYFDFSKEELFDRIPGLQRADIYAKSGTECKFVTTGGTVICRLYVRADSSIGGYVDYLDLIKSVIEIKDENGNEIADFHEPDHRLSESCYEL